MSDVDKQWERMTQAGKVKAIELLDQWLEFHGDDRCECEKPGDVVYGFCSECGGFLDGEDGA